VRVSRGRGALVALLAAGLMSALLAARPSAARRAGVEPRLSVDRIGPVTLPLQVPGATVFTVPGDLIVGLLHDAPYAVGVVQMIVRTPDGGWMATPAAVDVVRRSSAIPWTLPADGVGCHALRAPFEIAAVFARHRLPAGRIDPNHGWSGVVRSNPLTLSCAAFDASRVDVIDVGYTPVRPNNPPRVSHYEDVRVRVEHLPAGAIVQLCLQPIENPRIWCQEGAHPATHLDWLGTCYIGRPDIRRGPGGLEFVDQYSRFWLRALIVRMPLPITPAGISQDEWLALRPLVVKESRPVEVIRAYRPGQVRIVIVHLGDSTYGRLQLADPISRVAGQFRPLPGYRRTGREVISVLARRRETDKDWKVAGLAFLSGDLTHWLITAANLDPQEDTNAVDRVAIAVLTLRPFPTGVAVTEVMLRQHATSVSDEVRFRLFRPKGGAQ
jgi:hypothetical protein